MEPIVETLRPAPLTSDVIEREIGYLAERRRQVFRDAVAAEPPYQPALDAPAPVDTPVGSRAVLDPLPPGDSGPKAEAPTLDELFAGAHRFKPFGVGFSGGGIRSATFNLGVLQGLAEHGLLKYIDYLSTVSGGGYIGSWMHGVIKNRHGGDPASAERFLSPAA